MKTRSRSRNRKSTTKSDNAPRVGSSSNAIEVDEIEELIDDQDVAYSPTTISDPDSDYDDGTAAGKLNQSNRSGRWEDSSEEVRCAVVAGFNRGQIDIAQACEILNVSKSSFFRHLKVLREEIAKKNPYGYYPNAQNTAHDSEQTANGKVTSNSTGAAHGEETESIPIVYTEAAAAMSPQVFADDPGDAGLDILDNTAGSCPPPPHLSPIPTSSQSQTLPSTETPAVVPSANKTSAKRNISQTQSLKPSETTAQQSSNSATETSISSTPVSAKKGKKNSKPSTPPPPPPPRVESLVEKIFGSDRLLTEKLNRTFIIRTNPNTKDGYCYFSKTKDYLYYCHRCQEVKTRYRLSFGIPVISLRKSEVEQEGRPHWCAPYSIAQVIATEVDRCCRQEVLKNERPHKAIWESGLLRCCDIVARFGLPKVGPESILHFYPRWFRGGIQNQYRKLAKARPPSPDTNEYAAVPQINVGLNEKDVRGIFREMIDAALKPLWEQVHDLQDVVSQVCGVEWDYPRQPLVSPDMEPPPKKRVRKRKPKPDQKTVTVTVHTNRQQQQPVCVNCNRTGHVSGYCPETRVFGDEDNVAAQNLNFIVDVEEEIELVS